MEECVSCCLLVYDEFIDFILGSENEITYTYNEI